MQTRQERTVPDVGSVTFEVYGAGRNGRRSQFKLRCDAIGLHANEMLLLSVIGSETSVKALTAGLRSSSSDQKRIDYSAHVGSVYSSSLARCSEGYRIHRTKLAYDLWHVLCMARREGFMPVLTEYALWQLLQGSDFTTPLLREWTPWLYREMKARQIIVELTQSGCRAGVCLANNDVLDELVSEGIRNDHLPIGS
jgi:hypothetical protein